MNDIASLYRKFGFSEPPFNQTPDTSFLYKGKQHMAALDHLKYGLMTDGFTMLIGVHGMGKTLICRQILRTAGKDIQTVYIYNTYLNMLDLFKVIYHDLTGKQLEGENYTTCFQETNKLLLRLAGEGKKVVVLIDEAQGLDPKLLEGLRQLSNLETEKKKLLSFILIGQPELRTRLTSPAMSQLEQRISVRYVLKPFKLSETMDYIYYRMRLSTNSAISNTSYFFTTFAICLAHWYSRGIPRRINQICDRALQATFNIEKKKIGFFTIFHAAREVIGKDRSGNYKSVRYRVFVRSVIIATILGLGTYVGLDMYQHKLGEKGKSFNLKPIYLRSELTPVAKVPTKLHVIEKQTPGALEETILETRVVPPEAIDVAKPKQELSNPGVGQFRFDQDSKEKALDNLLISVGVPNPVALSGLSQ